VCEDIESMKHQLEALSVLRPKVFAPKVLVTAAAVVEETPIQSGGAADEERAAVGPDDVAIADESREVVLEG